MALVTTHMCALVAEAIATRQRLRNAAQEVVRRETPAMRNAAMTLCALALVASAKAQVQEYSGGLQFFTFALSASGAKCAKSSQAQRYLMQTMVSELSSRLAREGTLNSNDGFELDVVFSLDSGAHIVDYEVVRATSSVARTFVSKALANAVPLPQIPAEAVCIVGETYGLRIIKSPSRE